MKVSKTEKIEFLTEQSLGEILKSIFPTAEIIPQFHLSTFGPRKKVDYCIKINNDVANKMIGVLSEHTLMKIEPLSLIGGMLLVEYDGHYHYNSGARVEKDANYRLGNCKWSHVTDLSVGPKPEPDKYCEACRVCVDYNNDDYSIEGCEECPEDGLCQECDVKYEECTDCGMQLPDSIPDIKVVDSSIFGISPVFGLRIPYFIQVDSTICSFFFNDKSDFSKNFPHGFISKKCILPQEFSSAGESRFLNEIAILPPNVSYRISESLFDKIETFGSIERVINYDLLKKVLKVTHPDSMKLAKKVMSKAGELGKTYKRLNRRDYFIFWRDRVALTIYEDAYMPGKSIEELLEEIPHWENFNYGWPYELELPPKTKKAYAKIGIKI
jgi:hypothetical protein